MLCKCEGCQNEITDRWLTRALYCSDRCKKTAAARRLRARMTPEQRARRAAVQHRYHVKTYEPQV